MIPQDLLYTDQHEWIKVDGNTATMGISDYAQNNLGDITFIELPAVGAALTQGEEACSVESAKAASSIYAPASGKVTAVNDALEDDPSLVNSDPYGQGWICKIELADTAELDKLLSPEKYEPLTNEC